MDPFFWYEEIFFIDQKSSPKYAKYPYFATFWAGGKGHPEIFHFLPLNTLI
jgi:hypothetical protein